MTISTKLLSSSQLNIFSCLCSTNQYQFMTNVKSILFHFLWLVVTSHVLVDNPNKRDIKNEKRSKRCAVNSQFNAHCFYLPVLIQPCAFNFGSICSIRNRYIVLLVCISVLKFVFDSHKSWHTHIKRKRKELKWRNSLQCFCD